MRPLLIKIFYCYKNKEKALIRVSFLYGGLTAKRRFYTLRICRISCRLQELFELPNTVVTGMYEILHTKKGTESQEPTDNETLC
ncbi:hypothetical protein DN410_10715 [Bacillus sp. SH5-2]|nr:hypothetical protein DN410_10715 [Bacillus sp. SH5-2]